MSMPKFYNSMFLIFAVVFVVAVGFDLTSKKLNAHASDIKLVDSEDSHTSSVSKISDGDTLKLTVPVNLSISAGAIRFCGINVPEPDEDSEKSEKAKEFLSQLIGNKDVTCVPVGKGTPCDGRSNLLHGTRLVAQCFVDNQDIATELVKACHATDWEKFSGGYYKKYMTSSCENK